VREELNGMVREQTVPLSDLASLREESARLAAHLCTLRDDELPKMLDPLLALLAGIGACAGTLHANQLKAAKLTRDFTDWPRVTLEADALLSALALRMRQAYGGAYSHARDGGEG
jgi:hypothetical protein